MAANMLMNGCRKSFLSNLSLVLVLLFLPMSVLHTSATTPAEIQTISELAEKLDAEQRTALVKLLESLSADETATAAARGPSAWTLVYGAFGAFGERLSEQVAGLPLAIAGTARSIADVFSSRGGSGSLLLIGLFALVIVIASAANYLVVWIATPWRRRFDSAAPQTFVEQLRALSLRFALEISGLAAFTIAGLVAARVIVPDTADRALIVSFLLTAILVTRFAASFLRFVLGPKRPDLRLVAADDATASQIFKGLVGLAVIIGGGFFVLGLVAHSVPEAADPFRFWVGLFLVSWIVGVTWRSRKGLTEIIKGEDDNLTPGLERMATWWPTASMVIVALTWLFIQFVVATGAFAIGPAQGAIAISLVVAAPFLDTALRGIVRHLVPPLEGEGEIAEAAYHETRNSYVRIGRVIMFALLILIIGRTLGISFRGLAEASLGAQIAANGVQFLLVVAAGYIAWEIVNLWVNRRLAREHGSTGPAVAGAGDGEPGGSGRSRLASVLPLLHMTLQITIVIIVVLLALSQLGFNITPLLAGAGVLGLAIGFGAQTLVKDVVSGVFFLLDDAFRVGEFIDVGGIAGSVEKISVRSLQLRDPNGPVHIVPYGDIAKLTNNSRDYVIMKLKFTVPFDTDLEKVRKLFKKIGQQMMEDPAIAENMLEPFKSQGVADVNDVGIVLRGKFTAKPGTQWVIRKQVYTRVQKAFEENGIQFARKEVRVQFPGAAENQNLADDQKRAIAGAAIDAAEPGTTS